MINHKTGMTRDDVLKQAEVLIVTLGKQGAEIYTDGQCYVIPVFPLPDQAIVDPTGVGDAFRGGILRGMALGWPWDVTGRVASLCAAYVLEHVGTQSHHYTLPEFVARYRTTFDDRGVLDTLVGNSQTVRQG
jgi:adenosine kinase